MDVRSDDSDIDSMLGDTFAKVGESPSVLEQSAKLQRMIDEARGAPPEPVDPRTLPVRFSRLRELHLSAAHYLHASQTDFEETLAIRIGSGAHAGLFENRPVVCYDGRRQGKAWERFERHYRERDAVILNEKEYRIAIGMIDAVRRHKRASEILFDGTSREETILWKFGDRACRSTPDAYHLAGNHVSDLKSARCGEPRWFAREAFKRHYHCQLAFYADGIDRGTELSAPGEHYLVVVENVAPFNVVVWRLPDDTRDFAAKLCRQWWERLLAAETLNHFGGYVESDIDLEVPAYEQPSEPFDVEVDGQLVTID
ncbi:MAG: PD-(D/E)XK nuclease-like domain-containing protein [Kofleriaceae bacterium]